MTVYIVTVTMCVLMVLGTLLWLIHLTSLVDKLRRRSEDTNSDLIEKYNVLSYAIASLEHKKRILERDLRNVEYYLNINQK